MESTKQHNLSLTPLIIPQTPPTTPRTPEPSLSHRRVSGFTKVSTKVLNMKKVLC